MLLSFGRPGCHASHVFGSRNRSCGDARNRVPVAVLERRCGRAAVRKAVAKRPTKALDKSDLAANELENYLSAGHFSRFLVETRGWDGYARVLQGEPVERVFDQPVDELVAEYNAHAPYAYPPLEPCPFPPLTQATEGVWEDRFTVQCEDAGASQFEGVTYSIDPGVAVHRHLQLGAGTYAFELSEGHEFLALGCQTRELAEEPQAPSSGDLFNEVDGALPEAFPGVGIQLLELQTGSYRFSFPTGPLDEVDVDFKVTRVD